MADNLEKLTCPACGEEMKKIYLSEAGINIDLCLNSCGGILFDNREFEKVDELDEKIDTLLDAIKGKTFKKVDTSETRVCPICGTPMVKIGTEISGIEIDYCNSCAAKFLDNGELIKIRENPVGELSEEIKGLISNHLAHSGVVSTILENLPVCGKIS